jgi:ABC-type multidrug transport system permease subunit
MIFTTGRAAFLEYLRNLTPQILIITAAIIFGSDLDINRFDLSNTKASLPFVLAMATFFAAAIANMLNFFESSATSLNDVNSVSAKLLRRGFNGWRLARAVTEYIRRRRKILFLEIGIPFVIVQVGFLVVLFSSFVTATNIYKSLHASSNIAVERNASP